MIYFITEKNATENVKIGYTENLNRRIKELQIGNPRKLVVHFAMKGDKNKELELHKIFEEHRIIGEWFKFDKEITKYINQIKDREQSILDMYNTKLDDIARTRFKVDLDYVYTKLNGLYWEINIENILIDKHEEPHWYQYEGDI